LELVVEIATIGNRNSLSDAGVAVLCAIAGAEGAYYNVLINLAGLKDLDQSAEPDFVAVTRQEASRVMASCEQMAADARRQVRNHLEG
jgi:glutamate formiminotransferase / formiminotetrahydrofolate cyclodeaminase